MVTLIVSDIHLGSPVSRAGALLKLLRAEIARVKASKKTETIKILIILLGDIFSDLNFGRLTREQFELLAYLRELSNPKRGVEVVWIEGNHDIGLTEVMSHLVGIQVYQEYNWLWNGQNCLALHGHQFDALFLKSKLLSKIVSFLFLEAQKFRFFRNHFATVMDKLATKWQRMTPEVAAKAIRYARSKGASFVFCGHTHEAHQQADGDVQYFNTGNWVSDQCSFIRMTDAAIECEDIAA